MSNDLILETSPYLLQHASNPVHWKAWNEVTLQSALDEDRLLIISIGYSSCHWCHVMEEESFQDIEVAELMNLKYVCVKVDREERPDVDHVYMSALQLITGRGGWPLNIIALPDGRPVWAASYVPKRRWIDILTQVSGLYADDRKKVEEYATSVTKGLIDYELITKNNSYHKFSPDFLKNTVDKIKPYFDQNFGGFDQSPKFPLPNNLEFFLMYSALQGDKSIESHVILTLEKMAFGGIYDHVEGGFSRYSTDKKWHIPHFEKMLYDNAQLVSLYSKAFLHFKNPLFKEVVIETLEFVKNELTGEDGNFFSALDADSENEIGEKEEGAYYVWTKDELTDLFGHEFELISDYFNFNEFGKWENGKYILIRTDKDELFSAKNNIEIEELKQKVKTWKNVMANAKHARNSKGVKNLKRKRKKRNKPELDFKSLCSWNALMITAYCDAYRAFDKEEYLQSALNNVRFIEKSFLHNDNFLFHNFSRGISSVHGFLEDYAQLINAYMSLYQIFFDENYLVKAKTLCDRVLDHFFDNISGMFFFTSEDQLITRKIEVYDGVISSANSVMAKNLKFLGHYFGQKKYLDISEQMLKNMVNDMANSATSYSNWLNLYAAMSFSFNEICITGPNAFDIANEFKRKYLPNSILAAACISSDLSILKNRFVENETNIYICCNGSCNLPVKTVREALNLIKN